LGTLPTVDAATAATTALRSINKAITEHPDVAHPPCLTASITASNTLVVVVSDRHHAAEYTPYLGILLNGVGFGRSGRDKGPWGYLVDERQERTTSIHWRLVCIDLIDEWKL
jgi:hypothetical protein